MNFRILVLLLTLFPVFSSGQGVVIDIEYQPNATYEWTRSIHYDRTVEILGAEDMGEWLQQLGMESYSESRNVQYINVTMKISDWDSQNLYFNSSIDSLTRVATSSTSRPDSWGPYQPLEIHDLAIHGVINHFHKIEIDSIIGVDSLHEKNRVFTMLDEIHRSWTYPSDTLLIGVKVEKYSPYPKSGISTENSPSVMHTSYVLESIEIDIARIRLDYLINTEKENESGDLLDERIYEGIGTGLLLYDTKRKQVILREYTIDVKTYSDMMDMAMETTSTSTYQWTLNIVEED